MKCTCAAALALCLIGVQPMAAGGEQDSTKMATQRPADEVLLRQIGTWQATVTVFEHPGHPGRSYSGITTNKLGCGGRCLVSEYNSQANGQPFEGHGLIAFDQGKQKYIETWTDGMSAGLSTTEYTYNTAARTFTGTMTTSTASGQPIYMKVSGDYKSPNQRVVTLTRTIGGQEQVIIQCAMVLISQ